MAYASAAPNPELKTPVREVIHVGNLFGNMERIMTGNDNYS